jgi:hypothetical protein
MKQRVLRAPIKAIMYAFLVFGLFGLGVTRADVFEVGEPLDTELVIDLDLFRGQTFLSTMLYESEDAVAESGIVEQMDFDYEKTYEFPSWEQVEHGLTHFDSKNVRRVKRAFKDDSGEYSQTKLKAFVDKVAGREYKIDNLWKLLSDNGVKGKLTSIAHFFALAGSAGNLVIIDDQNYFYNIGYEDGEERSGRSYSASPEHGANDVSHKRYLTDLDDMLSGDEEDLFYSIMMRVLTNTDDSEFEDLTEKGQSVATDFIAVYVAELRRHLMFDLHPNRKEWSNDYIEVTLISALCNELGSKIVVKQTDKDGYTVYRFKEEPLWKWWELNPKTGRSGIGKTQYERRVLQRLVSKYIRKNHSDLAKKISGIVKTRGDLFQGLAEYLNNFDTPTELGTDGEELTAAIVDLVAVVQEDAEEIEEFIYSRDKRLRPLPSDEPWDGVRRRKKK